MQGENAAAGRPGFARAGRPCGGAPRCCAAGACGRFSAPCTGCKQGAGPPLAPALRSCLPRAGPGKAGAAAFGKICAGAGRPQAARAPPGQGAPQGRPPLLRSGGPAAGFLRLVQAVNGAPTRRLPLPHAAACGPLSLGSAGELANAAVLLQIVRRHSIFGHFYRRTA